MPEALLNIDHPGAREENALIGLEEHIDEGVPLRRIAQALGRAGEVQVATHIGATECRDELRSKHPTEDRDGEEEARVPAPNPLLVIGRQTAGGYDSSARGDAGRVSACAS